MKNSGYESTTNKSITCSRDFSEYSLLFLKCLCSFSVLRLQLKSCLQGQKASRKRGPFSSRKKCIIFPPLPFAVPYRHFGYLDLIYLIKFFVVFHVYFVSPAISEVCRLLCLYLLHSANCYIHNKSLFCLVITH